MDFTSNYVITETAMTQLGIAEYPGTKDNPEVLKYFDAMGEDGEKLKDETAWCSAFMNWVALEACVENSRKLNARSWLQVGEPMRLDESRMGDVVVLWRESTASWKGHVGIYLHHDQERIWMISGNSANRVQIWAYDKTRYLGTRRLRAKT